MHQKGSFGVIFDIDGVLMHGPKPLPHATEAIQKLKDHGVPHVYCTNNGMELEEGRALRLSKSLGIPILADQMFLAHSALRDEAARFQDKLVLVTGITKTCAKDIMRNHGFSDVATVEEYARCFPELLPNKRYLPLDDPSVPLEPALHRGQRKVAAIFVIETPVSWHEDLQVIIDLCRSDGRIGHPPSSPGAQDVQLFCCNYDFTFPFHSQDHRLGPGAFMDCLSMLYKKDVGRDLQVIPYGKPFPSTYRYAERALAAQAAGGSMSDSVSHGGASISDGRLRRVYCVGDNPTSDIRGANNAGEEFVGILVCTGVYRGGPNSNDPVDPADHVVSDVGAAVDLLLRLEGVMVGV